MRQMAWKRKLIMLTIPATLALASGGAVAYASAPSTPPTTTQGTDQAEHAPKAAAEADAPGAPDVQQGPDVQSGADVQDGPDT